MLWNYHWGLFFSPFYGLDAKAGGDVSTFYLSEKLDIWPQNAWGQTALLKKGGKDAGGVPQRRLLRVKRSWLCLLCSNTSHPTSCFAQGHLPRLKNLER